MTEPFKPVLMPKRGYVEGLDENGNHVYIPGPEVQMQSDTDALLLDYEYRITMLELGVTDDGE